MRTAFAPHRLMGVVASCFAANGFSGGCILRHLWSARRSAGPRLLPRRPGCGSTASVPSPGRGTGTIDKIAWLAKGQWRQARSRACARIVDMGNTSGAMKAANVPSSRGCPGKPETRRFASLCFRVPEIGFGLTVSSTGHALTQPGRLAGRRADQKFAKLLSVALALGVGERSTDTGLRPQHEVRCGRQAVLRCVLTTIPLAWQFLSGYGGLFYVGDRCTIARNQEIHIDTRLSPCEIL